MEQATERRSSCSGQLFGQASALISHQVPDQGPPNPHSAENPHSEACWYPDPCFQPSCPPLGHLASNFTSYVNKQNRDWSRQNGLCWGPILKSGTELTQQIKHGLIEPILLKGRRLMESCMTDQLHPREGWQRESHGNKINGSMMVKL